ncbi:DUF3426 domain-containing protein [Cellvibrio sp. PSBB023]|uniref:DUF3426 domain-containing protein n=1 Tax=Cellvibrio sp. PSBB023 TaxID=1945512 RepID=UPI00098EA31A|nr:DUF3426 domain-containing protein [Cellvibrio sp. PSBB023]AQT58879.1 hypothetical protein B0D95_01335 [Cellvibrio sp. PSBB023]
MTSASNPMITRCPKCETAFRVTQSQLQTAKGAVRCGSCLNVFKAQEYLVAVKPNTPPVAAPAPAPAPAQIDTPKRTIPAITPSATPRAINTTTPPNTPNAQQPVQPKAASESSNVTLKKPDLHTLQQQPPIPEKPVAVRKIIKPITLDDGDDILISDDMEEPLAEDSKYEFDSFMDIDVKPTTDVSLFERKIRPDNDSDDKQHKEADESWAEMLIDEEETVPQLGVARPKSDEELADEALLASHAVTPAPSDNNFPGDSKPATPGLVFSLVDETESQASTATDEFILSEELAKIPDHQGFQPSATPLDEAINTDTGIDAETPPSDDAHKRQVKTQPKIRAYDGSRAALLMNIIPAPIEFTAKSMRRWYQRKLWATLSLIGLITLAVQIAWFKFDSLSRIEPYRTAYLFACPYLGCELPTLVDTRQITTSNLVVREHPDAENALAVDVMIINGAPFDQPFPDLVLVFSDLDDNLVASRRFTPKDYLGGELAGRDLMPQNQKVYITLDIVDPGAEAVNYRIHIPQQ